LGVVFCVVLGCVWAITVFYSVDEGASFFVVINVFFFVYDFAQVLGLVVFFAVFSGGVYM
jgi:hypothetical protein